MTEDVQVTDQVVSKAVSMGFGGNIRARVKRMLQRAAPVTHDGGNRRYMDIVLQLEDNTVTDIGWY